MSESPPPLKRRRISVSSTATTVSHVSDDACQHEHGSILEGNAKDSELINDARVETTGQELPTSAPKTVLSSLDKAVPALEGFREHSQPAAILSSPVQLSHVDGLPASTNTDTTSLHDILGDPLIKECWAFNYLFDVEWMRSHFDEDVRDLIKLYLIHGSWRREDPQRSYLEEVTRQLPNVRSIAAYLPELFGTHHTKMFILLKHDDTAQVVVLTANMLERDWRMAQAVWRSPHLPMMSRPQADDSEIGEYGGGRRFKHDLICYLKQYEKLGRKLGNLVEQMRNYDFSAVRAALVASVPGRQNVSEAGPEETTFGWPGLARVLRTIPGGSDSPRIVSQVSSVASLGAKSDWLVQTFFAALSKSRNGASRGTTHRIMFPTAQDIRRTHNGYACGGSIHFKTQSPTNQKQVAYLRPMLCHWAGDCGQTNIATSASANRDAGRNRAGPHIKTYIRFSDSTMSSIDWAMVTSANLSKQAWGESKAYNGTVRICSYELGIVVWPGLFASDGQQATMIPTFKTDTPDQNKGTSAVIGFRMPYDLPLSPYAQGEQPWCASARHDDLDCNGQRWAGY